jgi:adenylate kinase family enzyme
MGLYPATQEDLLTFSENREALDVFATKASLLLRRRFAWLTHLRARYAEERASAATLALLVAEADRVVDEQRFYSSDPALRELTTRLHALESTLDSPTFVHRTELATTLGLSPLELDILDVLVATAVEPSLHFAFAHLHGADDFAYPSESAIVRLFGAQQPSVLEGGALLSWQLVNVGNSHPGEPRPLSVDPFVVAYYGGRFLREPKLSPYCRTLPREAPLPEWPLEHFVDRIAQLLGNGQALRVVIEGRERSGRRTYAHALAARLGFTAFGIDTSHLDESAFKETYLLAQRHAILTGALPVWFGAQVALNTGDAPAIAPLQFYIGDAELTLPYHAGLVDLRVTLPPLSLERRHWAFRRYLPALTATAPKVVEELAQRFPVELGDVADLGRLGATTAESVRAACRALRRGRLGELGQQLPCPFTREDIVLPERINRALDDILYEARVAATFWERPEAARLFPRGRGLIVLMAGPPGTGKTMAAQIIARELELDLVRIDLATTVSKYIGETAKNLKRIFDKAADMHTVLLFDEADALFTKRTEVKDAHDRYANADTNYLLQLLENYPGIALLASNRKQNIDTGFTRRIRHVLDFPRPAPEERKRIWQRLITELFSIEDSLRLSKVIDALSQKLELSGAQIKLSVLSAAFSTERHGLPLGMEQLLTGAERELYKESRGLTQTEQAQLYRAITEVTS